MDRTQDMFIKAIELGYNETPKLQEIWDKAVKIGREKYPTFDDYSVLRRFVSYMIGYYCDKALHPHNIKELLLMFIMKLKYNKHWNHSIKDWQ